MQTITCKKCGASFDASLGECPICGAVYYIISDQPAQPIPEQTPVQTATPASGFDHDPARFENVGERNIFETHPLSDEQPDPDATRAFRPVPPQAPEHRPAAPTPTRTAVPNAARSQAEQRRMEELQRQKKAKSKLVLGAIALLALLTLVLTVMSGAFNFGDKSSAERMPDTIGMTQETATIMLEELGLKVTAMKESSSELEGTVIKQSIKADKKLKDGQSVTITISAGEKQQDGEEPQQDKTVKAPDLTEKTYDQAYYEATNAGLLITTTADGAFSDTVPEGSVVSQSPAKGTEMNKGDIITLVLSKGPEASPSPETVSITALAGLGGSISPKGTVDVEAGGSATFTITPGDGFVVREVKVDGQDVGAVTSYTFSNITGSHTIYAVFTLASFE